jgi:hypothetical protein
MPQRQSKKRAPVRGRTKRAAHLRQALASRTKEELVDFLLQLAIADRRILQQLAVQFKLAVSSDQLVAATRQAIADATGYDERNINRNFDYDDEAYRNVKQNLGRLIAAGQLRVAMKLALELMECGSQQVEMSDEGIMAHDIEDCLNEVLAKLPKCGLPADEVVAWCSAMLDNDRVGFIARAPLQSLRIRFQAAVGR